MPKQSVGILGANSLVGNYLIDQLKAIGLNPIALSRTNLRVFHGDDIDGRYLSEPAAQSFAAGFTFSHLICVAPIWVLSDFFPLIEASCVQRVVALSSTSRFTKVWSSDVSENDISAKLINAEARLQAWAESRGIEWVVLRPTLIYGQGHDKNISEIARFIRRSGFFPLLGRAEGLRQPIHAEDVAAACVAALNAPDALNRAYNISGGETLSYREMVTRIFAALGQSPRLMTVPLWAFRLAISVVRCLPRCRHWSSAMAERMNQDLVFDHTEASRDLGFTPRGFAITVRDLLPPD